MPRGTSHAPPDERRSQILLAAGECFDENGYHRTTIDEIAARSGLSKGAIYWHFRGKRDIWREIFESSLPLVDLYREVAERAPDAAAAIREMLRLAAYGIPIALSHFGQLSFEYLVELRRDPEMRRAFRGVQDAIHELFAEQIRRGTEESTFGDVDPRAGATALIAAISGVKIQLFVDPEFDLPEALRQTGAVLLRGFAK